MNKHNTILGQMLDLISRSHFQKQVKKLKTEHGAKGFSSWAQLVTMLYGQVSNQHGLRILEQGMNSQRNCFYHLGITREIKRSTISYANANRDSDLFMVVFENLLLKAQALNVKHGLRFKNKLYSIDSTIIDLCLKLFPWADFRKEKGGIKLTVKLDHQGKIPCFVVMSNAREHDIKGIKEIPYETNDVLVFDRGYADYSFFEALCEKKVWFVTRMKKNALIKYCNKRDVKQGGDIVSDYDITLRTMSSKVQLRKIISRDPETGKKIVLLTNNPNWSSSTVAAVYKDRWEIELFFKTLKQNLKIKRFYGNSKNAVMTQIWIAMIAYLLFFLLKAKFRSCKMTFTNFISVVKTMLFHRVSLYEWLCGTSPPMKPRLSLSGNLEFVW